ncbi:MAG TPA: hypothetical protein VNQ76_02845 [Planctomicrobium sp.]|nr:hypothetical protein [Planctomicrobium sp.]
MHRFEAGNREFRISLHLDAIDAVRDNVTDSTGKPVDLLEIIDELNQPIDDSASLLNRIQMDRRLMINIVYAAVTADDPDLITSREFRKLMTPDAQGAASEALIREIISLFPQPRQGTVLAIWEQMTTIQNTIQEMIRKEDAETTGALLNVLADPQLLDNLSGSSPESLASTPDA